MIQATQLAASPNEALELPPACFAYPVRSPGRLPHHLDLGGADALDLLNGNTTKSGLQDMFGASRNELSRLEEVLGNSVDDKNRKMFFGVMIVVMVVEFDVDPDSDFCKQACGARDEMDSEDFEKMLKGNVSSKTIGEAPGPNLEAKPQGIS